MSARVSAAVNVFETLAIENEVSGVTWTPVATSASPTLPRQIDPSANRIAADMPGIPYFALRRARRASRASRRSGVALGLPMRRGHGRGIGVFGGRSVDAAGLGGTDDADGEAGGGDGAGAEAGTPEPAGDGAAVGVSVAAARPGDGVEVIAIGPADESSRGDISQPPTATLRTTSAIRIRRATWFTRGKDETCRPHHSASRRPVPSADD